MDVNVCQPQCCRSSNHTKPTSGPRVAPTPRHTRLALAALAADPHGKFLAPGKFGHLVDLSTSIFACWSG